MSENADVWQGWADRLHQWGLGEVAAALLEAAMPLNLVAAQIVYIGQPMLRGIIPADNIDALANLLEDPEETSTFVANLREKDSWISPD